MAPSDSDRDCSSAHRYHPADPVSGGVSVGVKWPPHSAGPTGPNQGQDSESGGSQPPSPRANRRRQVKLLNKTNLFVLKFFNLFTGVCVCL